MKLSHCQPKADHQPGKCKLCDYYEARVKLKPHVGAYAFPHCDAYVLHSPNSCIYCDDHASDMQVWRKQNNINFTNENNSSKVPCPAVARRDPSVIHAWYGNYPNPPSCNVCEKKAIYINLALACPDHGLV